MNNLKNQPPSIIALDGPAASGKTTVGRRLAETLGYLFFDTGIMYRAVTWIALDHDMDAGDEALITQMAQSAQIDIRPPSQNDGRACDVIIRGRDVTWDIRSGDVEAKVSAVSAYPGVRKALSEQQRRIGMRGKVVMVGRDIGTVVLPEADLKVYLDASAEERARRRYDELVERGKQADYEDLLKKMIERDRIDSTRAVAPLRPAEDAVVINTDELSEDQVYARVLEMCG
ncbi:MAG: (d)CMP kinase [Chloroflexi bacterium]|nr:(d)CMP kinase [Chloroflexi bacterium CFX1]MCQ3954487.1 (d)CMP kinase [Chloroflexota bacterium]MDL1920422.1 (d)CMP kinase [Chloroflexi bacterium CFX5]NUQ59402.1 (d)CMP kinase [Anaerolineales bacterium]RIK53623.1 MAG: (d)CMP kinase [Chloroflexota bacterium]